MDEADCSSAHEMRAPPHLSTHARRVERTLWGSYWLPMGRSRKGRAHACLGGIAHGRVFGDAALLRAAHAVVRRPHVVVYLGARTQGGGVEARGVIAVGVTVGSPASILFRFKTQACSTAGPFCHQPLGTANKAASKGRTSRACRPHSRERRGRPDHRAHTQCGPEEDGGPQDTRPKDRRSCACARPHQNPSATINVRKYYAHRTWCMHAAPQALETHERESHSHWRDEGEHGGHQPVGERHGVVSSGEAAAAVYNIAGAFHAREGGEESEVEHFAFVLAFGTEEKFPGPGGRPRKTILRLPPAAPD
jgi:hypothetical protein